MSEGGEDVRRVQEYLPPHSEHLIDWFHITMQGNRVAAADQGLGGGAAGNRCGRIQTSGQAVESLPPSTQRIARILRLVLEYF